MRLLFLCKRKPQGKDLLTRPYGRFFYLPYHLAQLGHEVTLLLLGYDDTPPVHCHAHGMEWYVENLRAPHQCYGPWAYINRAKRLIETHNPDWIIGFSDTWFGILAVYLGTRYNTRTLVDAYDNYESYIPWAKPLHWAWRYALKKATLLTAAGPELGALMSKGREQKPATIIPMAADPIFQPVINTNLRAQFNLPINAPLIGYCGSLHNNRGISIMFDAMESLLADVPNAKLVISGRYGRDVIIPQSIQNALIPLGYLPDEEMPLLLNALDVLLVINRTSAFGNFSYPVKLYEAMRCLRPVVASRTHSTSWVLKDHPECLANANDPTDIARRIKNALSWKTKEYTASHYEWSHSASILVDLLENAS